MTIWWNITGIVLALIGLALVNLIAAALVGVTSTRLRQLIEQGDARALLAQRLLTRPQELVIGLVITSTTLVLLVANLATVMARSLGRWAILWSNLTVLLLLFVFGVILPRTLGAEYAEYITLRTVRVAAALDWLLTPARVVLRAISLTLLRLLIALRLLPGGVLTAPTAYSEEDIKDLVTAGEQSGEVEASERKMIHGVIEFAETSAREIMIPRTDLVALPIDTTLEEAIQTFMESGHSRLPVYGENADDILGMLFIKDLLIHLKIVAENGAPSPAISALLRPAYFVPESKKSDELLREMQRRRVHLAIVVDEYGGTAGIITIEDLLEEIVGDIIDEYDIERKNVLELPDGTMLVRGQTSLDDIADLFDIPLPETEAETISGLITDMLGRIPERQDRVIIHNMEFTVIEVAHNRAEQLRVVALPPGNNASC